MTENYRQAAGCILLHLEGKETPRILLLRRSIEETSNARTLGTSGW